MKQTITVRSLVLAIPFLVAAPPACASTDIRQAGLGPTTSELTATYTQHVHVLASEYMQGRLPGTKGIERAAEYIEWHFEQMGLEPAFSDGTSYRQPFPIGDQAELGRQEMAVTFAGETRKLKGGVDFNTLAHGGSGSVELPVTFVGYSIPMGPDGYEGYPAGTDLSGKAAMILRYEPMNDKGRSQWMDRGWSYAATLGPKFRAAANRGAGAIIMVTPPGADDDRVGILETVETSGQGQPVDIPVVHITPEIADLLIKTGDPKRRSLDDLIASANQGNTIVDLENVTVSINCEVAREPILTDNLGAVLPGRGHLAGEFIVIGAHYDHLGHARFGTHFPGEMHLGADDNASGTAGVLASAKTLIEAWDRIDGPVRSVLFLGFSAEESGLIGSQYYVDNPIAPLDTHTLMINLDMIGSLSGQLEAGGVGSAKGLAELLEPVFERSGIDVNTSTTVGAGRSDHASFDRKGVPNLFVFTGITDRYHTPEDTADKVNFRGGAMVTNLVSDIALTAAIYDGELEFVRTGEGPKPGRRRMSGARGARGAGGTGGAGGVKVRVGIAPGDYSGIGSEGIAIARVFPGTSAADAGLQAGDRIIVWNGEKVASIQDWMPMLASHEPGDVIDVVIIRDGKEMTLPMTLKPKGSRSE